MSLQFLRNNIEKEKELIQKIMFLNERRSVESDQAIESNLGQIAVINSAIPELLNNITFYKKLDNKTETSSKIVAVSYNKDNLAIKKEDKNKFISNLTLQNLSEKKLEKTSKRTFIEAYANFSNAVFRGLSSKLSRTDAFSSLKENLRKISSPIMLGSYISMIFMTAFLGLILAIVLSVTIFISVGDNPIYIAMTFVLPFMGFSFVYIWPVSYKKSLEKNINQELPFLTIYMSAVATSGIEPTKIFSILANSSDYVYAKREIKKVVNYINFYGYDLVSSLRQASKNCPSEEMALLFNGLAVTITSGGELSNFLEKHSETLLFNYRLEREKYTRVAETMMNIYISIVIAAPMILMILSLLTSISDIGGSLLGGTNIAVFMIMIVAIVNMIFLLFLNMKQPKF